MTSSLHTTANTNKNFLFHLRRQDLDDREESPRPTKRRYSGPTMELTPRRNPLPLSLPSMQTTSAAAPFPSMMSKRRPLLLPKTPSAPLPRVSKPLPFLMSSSVPESKPDIFLPNEDTFNDTLAPVSDVPAAVPLPRMVTAGRFLKPRLTLAPKPTLLPRMLPTIQEPQSSSMAGTTEGNVVNKSKTRMTRRATMSLLSDIKKQTQTTTNTTHKKMRRRASLSLLDITRQAKSMERATAVPAPPRRLLKHSRSCHALCA